MVVRRLLVSLGVVVALGLVSATAPAKPKAKKAASLGAPNSGHLAGAVRMRPSKHVAVRKGAHAWGLPQLTKLVRRAADEVNKKHKGAVMLVGDLSVKDGGPLSGHASHQSGRDVDIGFYVLNSKGRPAKVRKFVGFDAKGHPKEAAWATFDEARNWALVEALVSDDTAPVKHIFVTAPIRAKLLSYAKKKQVEKETITRAATVMVSHDAEVHDDHFHVRMSCPEGMRECVEESTRSKEHKEPSEPAKPRAVASADPYE